MTRLEWQGELETHLTDIDSRLRHPRRRSTDAAPRPPLPELGPEITSELLDEIAWRVAEQIRARSADVSAVAAAKADPPAASPLKPGKMLLIRYKMPRLPWPLRWLQRRRRRRQHPLTTAKVRV